MLTKHTSALASPALRNAPSTRVVPRTAASSRRSYNCLTTHRLIEPRISSFNPFPPHQRHLEGAGTPGNPSIASKSRCISKRWLSHQQKQTPLSPPSGQYTLGGAILGYGGYRAVKSSLDAWFPSPLSVGQLGSATPSSGEPGRPPSVRTIASHLTDFFSGLFHTLGEQSRLASLVEEASLKILRTWVLSADAPPRPEVGRSSEPRTWTERIFVPTDLRELFLLGTPPDIVTSPPHSVSISSPPTHTAGVPTQSGSWTRVEIAYGMNTTWRLGKFHCRVRRQVPVIGANESMRTLKSFNDNVTS
ncbi:hypothetical protein M427DRAFT_132824 [Gonapodya prolifera JEL478]|uniref:Uncharacterized protein n=1 Tax=Gonapodya prolifera (strain JEL478) TaxID=1344416 RepID=A0A139AP23_GONPJ|nr:hypothetical protein M427DRAFT_132824 [Gonapodya prolifera JEL478]|eukprot:KXS18499.1 hypothetical protein M427DRAFT_132824 [Gonapodya prolifera JEL478]